MYILKYIVYVIDSEIKEKNSNFSIMNSIYKFTNNNNA